MASSSRSRHGRGRGRSRKQRPASGAAEQGVAGSEQERLPPRKREPPPKRSARERAPARTPAGGGFRDPLSVGERPQAPWHPWPLSELLILVGAIGTIVGLRRLSHGGLANGGPVLFAGLAAVVLGTLEITWREHRAGYRSHAMLLALLPVVVFHSVVELALAAFTTVPRLVNVGLLVIDVAVFSVLFKLLRARFRDARARVISRR